MSGADNLVDQHRKMVIATGNLSDFQLENLQKWPFLVFDNLKRVQVEYAFTEDVEVEGEIEESIFAGKVNFDLNFDGEPTEVDKAIALLTHWTKYLFWEDTIVTFSKDGETWPTT